MADTVKAIARDFSGFAAGASRSVIQVSCLRAEWLPGAEQARVAAIEILRETEQGRKIALNRLAAGPVGHPGNFVIGARPACGRQGLPAGAGICFSLWRS
jgi:hypothetical protein